MKTHLAVTAVFAVLCSVAPFTVVQAADQSKPNILFIAIDDMNDWTGFLGGHAQAKTPNMDRLAARGVNFTNAHTPAPACSPCRNALLFGAEPFHTGLYPFYDLERVSPETLAPYTPLPSLFKQNGYNTYGAGKIHHGAAWCYELDGADQWTESNYQVRKNLPELKLNKEAGYSTSFKMSFCPTASPLEHHPDYATAMFGVDVLQREHDQPFFLAVGFIKPHLPFICPQEYFDLYDGPIESPKIKPDDLADIPWAARSNAKLGDDLKFRTDNAWEQIRRSYLACISWTDANVGRVLDALEKSPYADNTIVVLWSDHGYHMGEKRSFRKFSLWEEATQVPFIIWDTRGQSGNGKPCDEAVSLIDIYPTLAELARVNAPDYIDGVSLAPWLADPSFHREQPATTSWGRGNYSLRTRDWRYTRYFDGSEELYHNSEDEQEWDNLADEPQYDTLKTDLGRWMPKSEAPLVLEGKALHNCVDADQPSLDAFIKQYNQKNRQLDPPLE